MDIGTIRSLGREGTFLCKQPLLVCLCLTKGRGAVSRRFLLVIHIPGSRTMGGGGWGGDGNISCHPPGTSCLCPILNVFQ